jgi:chromate transport protein ChrA
MLPYSSIALIIVVVLTVRHARSPLASERSKLAVIVLAVASLLLPYVIPAPVILVVLLQFAICAYIILHQTILTPEDPQANR